MSGLNIIGNIKTQTLAEWAVDGTIYTNQQILVVSDLFYTGTDQPKFSIANGTDTWVNLDYMPIGGGTNSLALVYESVVNQNMADSTSYYVGRNNTFGTNENQAKMFSIPACKIVAAHITKYIGSTFPSAGDVALTLVTDVGGTDQNDSIITDLNFQTALPRNAEQAKITLNIDVLEGMSYIRIDTPVWATNPVGANLIITLIMEPS